MKLPLLALYLLLAGCVAAPGQAPAASPIVRPIGADEAMQIVYDATSTAAVAATHIAEVTATERTSAATSTASYRQTQDTLAMRATEQQMALQAGQATQGAVHTLDSRTQAAHQTALWATPTVAAMNTQA